LLAGITPFAQSSGGLPQIISIEGGEIIGQALGEHKDVMSFKGVPYAKPPVGTLRWKPPENVETWEGIREATAYGTACIQPDLFGAWGIHFGKLSEDCLYLNVWSAANSTNDRRPVMMWIHGGGNVAGASQLRGTDGEALARQGVVVVSINYRLGIFGYFAHPLLSKESPYGVSGNYGLLDMIAALKWIQRNIKAFGGDPHRVTIFGQSAGAINISFLMASPFAKGLFHRAIAESGNALAPWGNRHLRERWYGNEPTEKQGERIVQDLGYSDVADPLTALRALSAEKLVEGSKASMLPSPGKNIFGPVIDGWALPDDLMTVFEGSQNLVPLMAGSNADEMTIFISKAPFDTIEAYQSMVKKLYGKFADDVLALYPVNEPQDIRKSMRDSQGDALFAARTRRLVRAMQKAGQEAYLYYHTMVWPGSRSVAGAFHGSEIIFVFDNVNRSEEPFEEKHLALAKVMSGYWVQFAATGNPNKPGAVEWPAYDVRKDQYLEFGEVVRVGQGLKKEKCNFWDNFVAAQRKNR
jgi:para-nitrobenzyl esterase